MNLTDIKPYLLHQFRSESELIKSINTLSDNFTKNRDEIDDYHNDEKLISAYAAFYLTTNYPKFSYCMDYLKEYEAIFKESEIIDIGVGPGTFVFSIGDYFNWEVGTIYGIETSHLMKKQAAKIKEGLYNDKDIQLVSKSSLIPKKEKQRIIIFTHSLNEMGNKAALKYIEELDPDIILFIEPGTKSLFKEYLGLRDNLIKVGFDCHYPCPSNDACPMQDKDDWCHQYIKVQHELEVSRLTQLAHKNRKWMPLTLGLYLNDKIKFEKKSLARIIRTYPETKYGFKWDICNQKNELIAVEVLKRDYTKKENKLIAEFLAGKEISFEVTKKLDAYWRIKIEGEIE